MEPRWLAFALAALCCGCVNSVQPYRARFLQSRETEAWQARQVERTRPSHPARAATSSRPIVKATTPAHAPTDDERLRRQALESATAAALPAALPAGRGALGTGANNFDRSRAVRLLGIAEGKLGRVTPDKLQPTELIAYNEAAGLASRSRKALLDGDDTAAFILAQKASLLAGIISTNRQ